MQKIPVRPSSDSDPHQERLPEPKPGYLPDALQTLLLGGIWWFVLIWLPLLQAPDASGVARALASSSALLFKTEGMVSACVALVLIALRGVMGGAVWLRSRESILLALIAACGIGLVLLAGSAAASAADNRLYLAGLQGIFALACFLARRGQV